MITCIPDSPTLLLAHDSEEVVTGKFAGLEIAAWSRPKPGRNTPNEDSAVIVPVDDRSAVFIVADGLGGLRGGHHASNLATRLIADSVFASRDTRLPLRALILDGLERANQAICNLGIGAATTIAAVEWRNGEVRPYHVGDSMILTTGQRGRIRMQTVSHSPVGFAMEYGLLNESEAMHHEERHLVSNVVGSEDMRIELGPPLRLARYDTVLLASDGLLDNLYTDEIVDLIRKGPLAQSLQNLVAVARKRMTQPVEGKPSKPDDMTVIALRQTRRR
ncbi:MAG: PP2C family protein-serine/threonine phosphatase [Planctomycetota bacterium]|jgi:serine/threonine protein phosphatase PrpC